MNTTTASESIRVPRLSYRSSFRFRAAVVAASIAAAAGITAVAISDGGSSSGGGTQPQTISRTGFGFEQSQAGATGTAQAFHHRTGQTLRSTLTPNVSAAQAVQSFHHR